MPPQDQNKRKSGTSNNEDKTGKRSRVSRACDQCRIAREKCDGVQPVCSTCSTSKRACTYTANPKKRGIQPGYIRSLELSLTWLFQNTDSEALLNRKIVQEGATSVLLGRDTKESNKLHKSWRRSRFCRDIDTLLSGEEISNHEYDYSKSPESDEEVTEVEAEDPSLHYQLPILQPQEEASVNIQRPYHGNPSPSIGSIAIPQNPTEASRLHNPLSNLSPQQEVSIAACPTPLPTNRWRLFDIYFAYTHCWFPICEKHDILKLTYSYPEDGLLLSSSQLPDSGGHAELWSILALASLQESQTNPTDYRHNVTTDETAPHFTPVQLYEIARTLIPLESGAFELGHVKALLILTLFNTSQSATEAAWLVVGYAARIVVGLQCNGSSQTSRFKHVFAACFLLDTLLSMQLQRHPYLQTSNIERIGKIGEDGLEEWQPWTGVLGPESGNSSRTPVLSLSTFNNLVEIVGIMSLTEPSDIPTLSLQEVQGRAELWKASLPPKFNYVWAEHVPVPSTPPAILLQLVYYCSTLVFFSSQSWLHRILELLERFRNMLGLVALPPILHCLLEIVKRNKAFNTLDPSLKIRFQKIQAEVVQAWIPALRRTVVGMQGPASAHSRRSFGSTNVQFSTTPDSIQIPYDSSFIPLGNSNADGSRPRTSPTLLDDLLPDMNSSHPPTQSMDYQNALAVQDFNAPQFEGAFNPLLHHHNSTTSRDSENFFDELASLDGTERVENQPQFMQNLGFAPDANMADLLSAEFGQFNPLNPTYMPQSSNDPNQLGPSSLYDPS